MALQLIGMLDSPYVRRVAISLLALGLPFEHRSLSVFRSVEAFGAINPVLKAPTAVSDDGVVLMDSTLILQYAESLARPRSLLPADPLALARDLRLVGLALAACEKAVQIVYERALRPPEKRHAPWIERVTAQLLAAQGELERALAARPRATVTSTSLDQATITAAVVWHFTQAAMPDVVAADRHPALAALSKAAEALPEFSAAPHGDGTVASDA